MANLFRCGGGVNMLKFPILALAELPAGQDGKITYGRSTIDITGFNFTKVKFNTAGHNYWGSKANAVLYGSKDGGATTSIIWSISNNNAVNQEVDITGYNYLRFDTTYTAGSYASGASFQNVSIS